MRRTLTATSLILLAALAAAGEAPAAGNRPNRGSPEARDARLKETQPEAFKEADADGDGKLSEAERAKLPDILARHAFATFDANHDGSVDKAEFIAGMKARGEERRKRKADRAAANGAAAPAATEPDEAKLGERFDQADADHDGKLVAEELAKATARGGRRNRGKGGDQAAPAGDKPAAGGGDKPETPAQPGE